MDIFGKALLDYQNGNHIEDIKTFSSLDEEDTIPVPYLFRNYGEMPVIEQKALHLCRGSVLDIGCGAGSHSLYLQEKGFQVTALDSSQGAIETCKRRGVKSTQNCSIQDFKNQKFDTLLLLMNGIGIVGLIARSAVFAVGPQMPHVPDTRVRPIGVRISPPISHFRRAQRKAYVGAPPTSRNKNHLPMALQA